MQIFLLFCAFFALTIAYFRKKLYFCGENGYAGKYKEELNRLDDSKKYTLEEIEKYKLLYDPAFMASVRAHSCAH